MGNKRNSLQIFSYSAENHLLLNLEVDRKMIYNEFEVVCDKVYKMGQHGVKLPAGVNKVMILNLLRSF
jgi:hypothetical protein